MRLDVQRIRARYILALSLVAVLVTCSAWILDSFYGEQSGDARRINIAGMQRMLSQKIALHVHEIQEGHENAQTVRVLLREAINQFQKNHIELTQKHALRKSSVSLSPEAKALYYSGQPNLDHRVKLFIEAAEQVLHGKFMANENPYFESEFVGTLLRDLNQVVFQYEAESRARLNLVESAEFYVWLMTMVLLIVEGLFIFRPMSIAVNRSLERAESQRNRAEKYRQRAEAANHTKSQLLAKMSHELRTPLNSISATIQAVQEEDLSKETKSLVYLAENSLFDLLVIFDDLLDVTRIDDQAPDLIISDFKLEEVINESVSAYSDLADKKGLLVEVIDSALLHESWLGDKRRIARILSILISNAVKFTEQGKISLSASMIETDHTEKEIQFRVKDTGIGMSPDVQARMFKKFEQGDNSSSRKYGGVGLGLTIAKHLADIMQGDIYVESIEGEGSIVTLSLPLIPSKSMNNHQKINGEQVLNLEGKDILIAEDNLINQMVILSLLEKTNANLRMAENGEQVVNLFKDKKPDIVLMDIQMPIKDGIDACIEIKDMDASVPVIAVTANASHDDQKNYDKAGFDSLIPKPIKNEELFRVISNRFGKDI